MKELDATEIKLMLMSIEWVGFCCYDWYFGDQISWLGCAERGLEALLRAAVLAG